MKLSSLPPGIYACWVSDKSLNFFINKIESPKEAYCLYETFTNCVKNYQLLEVDLNTNYYKTVLIESIDIKNFNIYNYPELLL